MKVVVPQPTCAYTLKDEVPASSARRPRRTVAENTFEAAEFLMNEHRAGNALDTNFEGKTYESIVWHAACHYRPSRWARRARSSWQLTGAKVQNVERVRRDRRHLGAARGERRDGQGGVAKPLMDRVASRTPSSWRGDCQLANVAIGEEPDAGPSTRCQVLAQAYGIEED
ncbi:MAG: hypothetical protein KatS3mg009_2071 [Acidimicrobiia bacterium]|nr:MAG: hypothetical protein KatS3mg009_2071 [Acidimicrobiia bacterium]